MNTKAPFGVNVVLDGDYVLIQGRISQALKDFGIKGGRFNGNVYRKGMCGVISLVDDELNPTYIKYALSDESDFEMFSKIIQKVEGVIRVKKSDGPWEGQSPKCYRKKFYESGSFRVICEFLPLALLISGLWGAYMFLYEPSLVVQITTATVFFLTTFLLNRKNKKEDEKDKAELRKARNISNEEFRWHSIYEKEKGVNALYGVLMAGNFYLAIFMGKKILGYIGFI